MPTVTASVFPLFLSCVTKEFRPHREMLTQDLTLPQVKVQVQEDFIEGGQSMLAKLNGYIRHCVAVIHLVGSGTGSRPKATEVASLMKELANFTQRLPLLKDHLDELSYTQWEVWLAIYHEVPCYIYRAEPSADRAPGFVEDPLERQRQDAHWDRFQEYGKDRTTFQSADELCRLVLRSLSTILPGGVHKLNVIPKGLRSFDAKDAAFFLDLLPGLHDEHNLPESIRFWKYGIEERDEPSFTVGVIYGPSGCGKSSLVKAGLLPRLAPQVVSVYIEATIDGTEARLLKGLRRRCDTLANDLNLPQSLTALGTGHGLKPGSKLVIVIDQFEQWLHARRIDQTSELIQALRQCDGEHVQAILIVRDDFWSDLSRFAGQLDVPLLQGQNSMFVDLFDPLHAENVLAAFGRGYGRLEEEATAEQRAFIHKAVEELSQNGRVISVRLALFADMVKGKPWIPKTLKDIGGIEGVGFTFLEEKLSASAADPDHRRHQKAAQNVLNALLPATGTDIKGHMLSHGALLQASDYAGRPQEFDALLRVLDGDLRLITPTNPGTQEEGPHPDGPSVSSTSYSQWESETQAATLSRNGSTAAGERYYQLTHDYLVPSIRDWLTRKQRESWRGRAELTLAERTIQWSRTPERRFFPSIFEYVAIQLGVRRSRRSSEQRRMMRAAALWYRFLILMAVVVLGVLSWTYREVNGRTQGKLLVNQIRSAAPRELPGLLDKELPAYRRWADPLLRDDVTRGKTNTIRLHASLALLDVDDSQTEYLAKRLLDCTFDEFPIIRERLHTPSTRTDRLQQDLWPVFRGTDRPVARTSEDQATTLKARLRAGMALAQWSTPDAWTEPDDLHFLAERLTAENPIHQAVLLDELRPLAMKLTPLLEARFRDANLRETERVAAAQALLDYVAEANDIPMMATLLLDAEPAQYEILFPLALQNRDAILPLFQRIAAQEPDAKLPDVERITLGKARAGAAVSLIRLKDSLHASAALQVRDDPEAVTQFAHRQRPRGVTPDQLLDALETASAPAAAVPQSSPTVRFGLLIALGEFEFDDIPESRREKLVATLDDWYRHDPRSAIHGAVGWLLRTWGQTEVATEVDRTPLAPDPTGRRDWFVDVVRGETEGRSFEDSFTFVVFPAGEFEMGSPDSENARSDDERLHHVRLTRPIAVCDRELTVGQWQNFERATGRKVKLDDKKSPTSAHPMNFVNWYGAVHYCQWLTTKAGGTEVDQCYDLPNSDKPDSDLDDRPFHLERSGYRLPTEAEWEYASRSGLRSSYGFGSDRALLPLYANYLDTSNDTTRIGGSLRPNGRGVFDMHGNILEWCHDWHLKDYAITDEPDPHGPAKIKNRILRGGSWSSAGRDCRSADRHDYAPGFEGHRVGFRLAKVVPSPTAGGK